MTNETTGIEADAALAGRAEFALLCIDQLTEPGEYWWLPAIYRDTPSDPTCWTVISWHPEQKHRHRSGQFIGPIVPPLPESRDARKDVLLKAAYEILKKCDDGAYVKNVLEETAIWDDAECDGFCLMEEIGELLGIEA